MYPRTLTISSVGQITLPKKLRELLGVKNGDEIVVDVNESSKSITIKPRKTVAEVLAIIDQINSEYPNRIDPRAKHMTAGEIALEQARDIQEDTWV